MNKYITGILALITFTTLSLKTSGQILNGDFTNWAPDSLGILDVVNWTTTNSNTQISAPTVLQDTDRVGGNSYSAKLVCEYDSSFAGPSFTMMELNNAPFSNSINPTSINGFWKNFNPNLQSQIGLEIDLFDSTNTNIGHASIGTPFGGSIINWTAFSKPITYTSSNAVKSYSIILSLINLSNIYTPNGNFDDLTFDVSTFIQPIPSTLNIKMILIDNLHYRILLSQNEMLPTKVTIYDINGRKLLTIGGSNEVRQNIDLDLSSFASGIYNCVVENGMNRQDMRIIISR